MFLMPYFTEQRDKDRAIVLVPPTSLAAPAMMAVIVPRRPRCRTLSSRWASPSHHRCPCQHPECCCLPSNLVTVAIALSAVANARFVAHHPRSSSLSSSLARHHCRHRHHSCCHHHCLFVACHHHPHCHRPFHPHPCPLCCLPASSPSPSPTSSPSPSTSPLLPSITCHPHCHCSCRQSHCSLRCTPPSLQTPSPASSLSLFVTCHPSPHRHRHCLSTLTLFITCSHC